MKAKHTPTSINLLYWLSNFSLVMLSIALFVVIVVSILAYTKPGSFDKDLSYTIPFPVNVKYISSGTLLLNNQEIKVELVDATARLEIHNPPPLINKIVIISLICTFLFSGLLIVLFRKFIKNVKAGQVFSVENINLLKYLSYGLVIVWVFQAIIIPIFHIYIVIANQLEFKDQSISVNIFHNSSTLVIALVIWMLAHIFLHGVRLQQEKDLTI